MMKNLKVVIVGGGIGGFAAAIALARDGHGVTLLEGAAEFTEAGAGIRVPPNSLRLLKRWGIDFGNTKKELSLGNRFLDWKDQPLLDVPYDEYQRSGTPYYMIHRADFIALLVSSAKKIPNITVKTNSRVIEYDCDAPKVKTEDGTWYSGDLVVAADGIKSSAREIITGSISKAIDTGDVAYRILVPSKAMLDDPDLASLMKEPRITSWCGPEIHFVGYPLRDGELYNMVLCCSVKSTSHGLQMGEDDWLVTANNAELVKTFQNWCPRVEKMIALAGSIPFLKWKLSDLRPLSRWVHPSNKVVLLGDSCHPMLPYLAQGAAQACEDAATLTAAILQCSTLAEALPKYEGQRRPRAEYVTANTRIHQEWLHIYDGPVREERDRLMQRAEDDENPILWGNNKRRNWLFGHDAAILLTDDEQVTIPSMPPMPPRGASVYESRL